MAGTTYSKFFWQDWIGDDELALCSMAARGAWMGMLAIAARSRVVGHVLLGGKKPSLEDLRHALRCQPDVTDAMLAGWIKELVERGVCDTTREGVIVSRRMVRDAQKHRRNSEAGKKSAAVRLGETTENQTGSKGMHQPPSARVQSPESISQSPSTDSGTGTGSLEKALSKAEQLCNAIGESLTADVRKANWPTLINRMVDAGVDFDCVLNIARRMKAEGMLPPDGVRTPMFFEARARDLMRKGGARPVEVVAVAPDKTESEWWHALAALLMVGAWVRSEWGPSPFEPGCKAPPAMLAKAKEQWEKQDNHPSSVLVGNAYLAWEPRYKDQSLIPEPRPFHALAA